MGKVTVVGSYIVALVIDTDRIPLEGETVVGRNYHSTHGGKGSNMAVAAARLGAQSTFIGKIGRDSFGKDFVSLLRREGVNADGVLYSDQLPTAVGIIICSKRGTNAIVIDMAANSAFLPKDVAAQQEVIATSDVIVSPLEIPLETALAAAQLARKGGKKAILNPAPAVDLRSLDLSSIYALTPNEIEGRTCVGLDATDRIDDAELAVRLLDLGAKNVILTLGAKGVIWACRESVRKIPALKVDAVDTVGAGDAFNAGLATGLSEHRPLLEAIALGVTAASLSTRRRETIDSYPCRPEVDEAVHELLYRSSMTGCSSPERGFS
jgi:ribokinase